MEDVITYAGPNVMYEARRRLPRQHGFFVVGYETLNVLVTADNKRVPIKAAQLVDTSKYPGEKLRELRKLRGVGPVRDLRNAA